MKLIAIGQYEGTWYGLLGGVNARGRPKTGIVDLSTSKFLLQPPRSLANLAVDLVDRSVE